MPLNLKDAAACAPVALLLGRLYTVEPDAVLLQHLADAELAALWPLEDGAVVAGLRVLQAEAAATLAGEGAEPESALSSGASTLSGDAEGVSPPARSPGLSRLDILHDDHMRLFGGYGMPEAPPWGSVYLHEENLLLQESTLALEDFWRQRGLVCTLPGRQPLDHLGLCLEGLALLLARCGQAAGDAGSVGEDAVGGVDAAADNAASLETSPEETPQALSPEDAAAAVRELLGVHVLPWAVRCTELVREKACTDFYRAQARLTQALFSALLSFFEVRPITRILYY